MEMPEDQFLKLPSGCRICYQTFGDPKDPAIVLIAGYGQAMTQKFGGIIQLLNTPEHPYFVVRFDHRDTGLSSAYPQSAVGQVYTLQDMVDDVLGLIKHLELERVHLMGGSMGGPISWMAASQLPDVTASLALLVTSPVGRIQNADDKLPPLKDDMQDLMSKAIIFPLPSDGEDVWIESYMAIDLALATQPPTEEELAESRLESETTYRREFHSGTMWSKPNHGDAAGVRWPRELLKDIKCPTVVIHAELDQLFPIEHAEALRDDLPDATLVVLEGVGHESPHRARKPIADAILANVAKGEHKWAAK